MHSSTDHPATSAPSGSARAFVAARLRRRQQVVTPPQLRWERYAAAASGSALHADGTPVWALRLTNGGGDASAVSIVLFTAETVIREDTGDTLAAGRPWAFGLQDIETCPPHPVWGYALAKGTDGTWYAATVDGRQASFRSRPDELGVLRTLGLRMPLGAEPHAASVRVDQTSA
ncbi:MAG: hypothetical protein AAGC46_06650 [Solirubrobacteraceae bacterium]|nr:hypothetical protein [Patulibacter sp.]